MLTIDELRHSYIYKCEYCENIYHVSIFSSAGLGELLNSGWIIKNKIINNEMFYIPICPDCKLGIERKNKIEKLRNLD